MAESASVLSGWSTFFATMCTSDAALIGLMFVVITLVAGIERRQPTRDGLSTYSSPNVMHFCGALFVSAVLIAPWHSLLGADVTIGLGALYGIVYSSRVLLRARQASAQSAADAGESGYVPDVEDWAWYTILPFVAYCAIVGGAIALARSPTPALYAVAAGVLLLTFIGIRNAWDVVTYLTVIERP